MGNYLNSHSSILNAVLLKELPKGIRRHKFWAEKCLNAMKQQVVDMGRDFNIEEKPVIAMLHYVWDDTFLYMEQTLEPPKNLYSCLMDLEDFATCIPGPIFEVAKNEFCFHLLAAVSLLIESKQPKTETPNKEE